jgi:hypothetical protein
MRIDHRLDGIESQIDAIANKVNRIADEQVHRL